MIKSDCVLIKKIAAFGDYSGGFGGIECDESVVIDGINEIHEKGGKVKLAFGGALYSMAFYIETE